MKAIERLEFHCFYIVSVSTAYNKVDIAYYARSIAFTSRMCLQLVLESPLLTLPVKAVEQLE